MIITFPTPPVVQVARTSTTLHVHEIQIRISYDPTTDAPTMLPTILGRDSNGSVDRFDAVAGAAFVTAMQTWVLAQVRLHFGTADAIVSTP